MLLTSPCNALQEAGKQHLLFYFHRSSYSPARWYRFVLDWPETNNVQLLYEIPEGINGFLKKGKGKKGGGRKEEKRMWEAELQNTVMYDLADTDSPQISKQKFSMTVHRLFIPTQPAKFIHVWLPIGKRKKTQPCSTLQKQQQTGACLYDLCYIPLATLTVARVKNVSLPFAHLSLHLEAQKHTEMQFFWRNSVDKNRKFP